MRKNKFSCLSFLVFMFAATGAQAADVSTVGDLAKITADTIMFNAEAARDQAQRALASAQGSSGNPMADDNELPNLRQIIEVNGIATGDFVYAGDVRVEKGIGDKLPGGYTVLHLWPDKLSGELKDKNGKIIPIGMSNAVPDSPKTSQVQNIGGVAGMPGQNYHIPPINGFQR